MKLPKTNTVLTRISSSNICFFIYGIGIVADASAFPCTLGKPNIVNASNNVKQYIANFFISKSPYLINLSGVYVGINS